MENEIIIPEEIKKEISSLEEWTRTVAVRNPVERTTVYQAIQTVKAKKKRKGRNPQTGKELMINARKVVTFRPSQVLKGTVND